MAKYRYTKADFDMRGRDDDGKVMFSPCNTAYSVSGEGLPSGLPLIVHKECDINSMYNGFWVVSERQSGMRFPDAKCYGYTRDKAVDEALALIEKVGEAHCHVAAFMGCNEIRTVEDIDDESPNR